MKSISRLGLYGVSAALASGLVGCATEKIMVDYVMPAKAVSDVNKVNVAAIKVKANVTGNLAEDNKKAAGLVKQLLAMRLYKEGFYQIGDDIWSTAQGASALETALSKKDAGHGYAMIMASGQGSEKVVIDVELDLSLNANPAKKEVAFALKTVPFKRKEVKEGQVPVSVPDAKAIVVENVTKEVDVYELVAKGTLKAKFVAPDGSEAPQSYENTFEIAVPEADRFDSAKPSQLKALAAVVSPVVDGIVSDISPYKVSRELVAVEGGDARVVYLLNAKAFAEVVTVVEKLEVAKKANFADFENLGIAFEAMGDLFSARDAYAKAMEKNPASVSAQEASERVKLALSGKKAVKASGAKQNKDTQFSR